MRRLPHPLLLVALAITLLYGGLATWRRANRPPGRWVGITECSWIGEPRIRVRAGLRQIDSIAVFAHESVHASQCRRYGPLMYRLRTLRASSNLALEAPAYCAGGRVRARTRSDSLFVRITMPIDMMAAMGDELDSLAVAGAIRDACPEFGPR